MASKRQSPKLSTSPQDMGRYSTDDNYSQGERLYPTEELRQMTDESSDFFSDISYGSTQSFGSDEERELRDRHETSYSSRSSSRSTPLAGSVKTQKADLPQGLKLGELKRRALRDGQRSPVKQGEVSKMETTQHSTTLWMIILTVILLLIWNFYKSLENKEPTMEFQQDGRKLMVANFVKDLKHMMSDFPSQNTLLWATVAASSKSVLKTEMPSQPGIMLLVSSEQGKGTVRCLTQKMSDILRKVYNDSGVTVFYMDDHLQLDGNSLKLAIDEKFRTGLGDRKEHVAVLHNLEKVSGYAAMMFHAYCDNLSAPFKDAIIMFTMELSLSEDHFTSMTENSVGRLVESRLQELWENDIGYDNTMALKSRLANYIAVVKAENSPTARC